MKNKLFHLILTLLVLATASCTDETIINENQTLRISGGIPAESRTIFVHGEEWTRTHWVTEDAIGLYSDNKSNVAYKSTSGDSSTTEFVPSESESIDGEEGQQVTAYYPYNSNATEDEVPLPYTVAMISNQPAPAFLLGEGTVNNNEVNLKFKPFKGNVIKIAKMI